MQESTEPLESTPSLEKVGPGKRNQFLYKEAVKLARHKALSAEGIRLIISVLNSECCEPPLTEQEVDPLVRAALQMNREDRA